MHTGIRWAFQPEPQGKDPRDVNPVSGGQIHPAPPGMSWFWTDQATCVGVGDFYSNSDAEQQDLITRYCRPCPVRAECLNSALLLERHTSIMFRHGIWGGLTPSERWHYENGHDKRDYEREIAHGTPRGFHQHLSRKQLPCIECVEARAEAKTPREGSQYERA